MATASHPCLLLAYDYTALRIIDFKQAFKLVYTEKAEVVSEFKDKIVRTVSQAFKLPAVIRLLNNFKLRFKVRLTRKNIFVRDNFCCKYCGSTGSLSSLTLDHVTPRSRGGKFTWENIVTSCLDCNAKKGDRMPGEAKMSLRGGPPKRLDMYEYLRCLISNRNRIPEWENWLP